jgi:hypothetical protein
MTQAGFSSFLSGHSGQTALQLRQHPCFFQRSLYLRLHEQDLFILVSGIMACNALTHAAGSFPALLRALEGRKQDLGVGGCAVTVTSLEEVFLRVSEGWWEWLGDCPAGEPNQKVGGRGWETALLGSPTRS